jgi:hypothetical protein
MIAKLLVYAGLVLFTIGIIVFVLWSLRLI